VGATLGELVREGERRFKAARLAYGHGLPTAYDEAAHLALYALDLTPHELTSRLEHRPTAIQARRIRGLFERRIKERRPVAYLTGEAWLGEYRFRIDERTIIPRSYIAELLHERLAPWVSAPSRVRSALDLCTGSGCLAVMLACSFPRALIDAADISRAALNVARRNVAMYKLHKRIRLVQSDLFSALAARQYDLIVSNPPYVTAASMQRLPPEYRYEPSLALAGGRDGLDIVRGILQLATAHLRAGGMLVLEVGHSRSRVERLFPSTAFVWPDTSGGDDCVLLVSREELVQASQRRGF
jgi:ribosomal protein L3 glutamine methyltransferase